MKQCPVTGCDKRWIPWAIYGPKPCQTRGIMGKHQQTWRRGTRVHTALLQHGLHEISGRRGRIRNRPSESWQSEGQGFEPPRLHHSNPSASIIYALSRRIETWPWAIYGPAEGQEFIGNGHAVGLPVTKHYQTSYRSRTSARAAPRDPEDRRSGHATQACQN